MTNEHPLVKKAREYKEMPIADRPRWQGPHCDKCGVMLLTKSEVMTHECAECGTDATPTQVEGESDGE